MNEEEKIKDLAGEYVKAWLPWVLKELSMTGRELVYFHDAIYKELEAELDRMNLSQPEREYILSHFLRK